MSYLFMYYGMPFHYRVDARRAGMVSFFKSMVLYHIFLETDSEAHLGMFLGAISVGV